MPTSNYNPQPLSDLRLQVAADLVRQGSVVADIGTDHGFLVCHLVASGRSPCGFACDINPGPLQRAERTITAQNLSRRVEPLLADGLHGLEQKQIDDIIIMGMGGELIARIMEPHPWIQNPHLHFVLQPMTRAEYLRRFLYQAGFAIQKEVAVAAGRFVYSIFSVIYTGFAQEITDLFAWTGLLWYNKDKDSLAYLARVAKQLSARAEGLYRSGQQAEKAAYYEALSQRIHTQITHVSG